MNWDEDIDLLSNKKSSSKSSRRSSNFAASPDNSSRTNSPREVPMRAKKTGVWSDEGIKSSKGRGTNLIEQERFQNEKLNDSDDDIPIIPDIDDIADDPLNLADVKVPNVTVKKSTYKELDGPFASGQQSFAAMGDIDLSVLTSRLYPEKDVQRCTQIWTMESLFQDLSKQQ